MTKRLQTSVARLVGGPFDGELLAIPWGFRVAAAWVDGHGDRPMLVVLDAAAYRGPTWVRDLGEYAAYTKSGTVDRHGHPVWWYRGLVGEIDVDEIANEGGKS